MNTESSTAIPLAITLIAVLTSGCASITGTTHQSISVETIAQKGKDIPGATCELRNHKGTWLVTTPGSVTVTRSNDEMHVLCDKQGLSPGRASVISTTKLAMFGNILLGGGIGALVDYNSGAGFEYPAFVKVTMGTSKTSEAPNVLTERRLNGNPNALSGSNQTATTSRAYAATPEGTLSSDESYDPRIYVIPNPLYNIR